MAISNPLGSFSAGLGILPDAGANSPSEKPSLRSWVANPNTTNRGNAPRRAGVMYARTGSLYASLDGIPRLVHRIELFRELSLSDCEEIAMAARERSFTQGTTIFLEDDPVRFVYAVVSGRVKSIRSNRVGKLVILHLTGPGEIVDGLGFAIGSNHSFTANAMTRCQVLTWDLRVFDAFVRRFHVLQHNATRLLTRRLRLVEGRLHELATERVPQRLARVLLRLIVQSGSCASCQPLDLSCEELAQMAGTTLSTVSRLRCKWAAEGIIQPERSAILAENLPGLIDMANGGENHGGQRVEV